MKFSCAEVQNYSFKNRKGLKRPASSLFVVFWYLKDHGFACLHEKCNEKNNR